LKKSLKINKECLKKLTKNQFFLAKYGVFLCTYFRQHPLFSECRTVISLNLPTKFMDSKTDKAIVTAQARQNGSYVGASLVVRTAAEARATDLNQNRNYAGRFNINIEAMAEALEKQGRCDSQLLV